MSLFEKVEFTSHAGKPLTWKIECDALTEADWECAAYLLAPLVSPFGSVEGVPRGGLALAAAMESYVTPESPIVCVCDDVLTTGDSMRSAASRIQVAGGRGVRGAVLFARGYCPSWIVPLFSLNRNVTP